MMIGDPKWKSRFQYRAQSTAFLLKKTDEQLLKDYVILIQFEELIEPLMLVPTLTSRVLSIVLAWVANCC